MFWNGGTRYSPEMTTFHPCATICCSAMKKISPQCSAASPSRRHIPRSAHCELRKDAARSRAAYPNLRMIATTLRIAHTASRNAWAPSPFIRTKSYTSRSATSTLSTASAAEIPSRPALSTGPLTAQPVEWVARCGRAWRACHDHRRRHQYGHAGRGGAEDEGQLRQDRALMKPAESTKQRLEQVGLIPVLRAAFYRGGPRARRRDDGRQRHRRRSKSS